MRIAYLYQELGIKKLGKLQRESDLDLRTLPLYACKVPAFLFYPFVTYYCGTWFTTGPNFIIPTSPLNRLEGKYWLDSLALSPAHLVNPEYSESKYRLAWIEADGTVKPENVFSHAEIIALATSARTYLLDEIRYVYDENQSALDGQKSSEPSRHFFSDGIASFENTKEYLTWYIDIFNRFFDKLLELGVQTAKEKRTEFLVAGWTINRLAIDTLTISCSNAPYIRKWQLFGLLDALGNLINQTKYGQTSMKEDSSRVQELLTLEHYKKEIYPALEKIPILAIRDELITHTQAIYESIESMKTEYQTKSGKKVMSGPELLHAYRNSRHGYAISDNQRRALIAHDGKIPDDIPDLCIALWHYLLLEFPFKNAT